MALVFGNQDKAVTGEDYWQLIKKTTDERKKPSNSPDMIPRERVPKTEALASAKRN